MRFLTTASTIDDLTGMYGDRPQAGILIDHLHLAEGNPDLRIHATGTRLWVIPAGGGKAVPVVCGHLISIFDEDGRHSGRCGQPVVAGDGNCENHKIDLGFDDYETERAEALHRERN